MNNKKSILIAFVLMLLTSIVYRIFPNRPLGFAPQLAIGLLAGAMVGKKAWAFVLPLLSMFLSDILYHLIYLAGYGNTPGFYTGQWINYLLLTLMTVFGFGIKNYKIINILLRALAAPSVYFILSNGVTWMGGGGYARPKTWSGLMQCYSDGIPFYQNSILSTVIFSAIFFGVMYWIVKADKKIATVIVKH